MIPNELPLTELPPPEMQRLFTTDISEYLHRMYPRLDLDISPKISVEGISVRHDTTFAKWVLGQKQIYLELTAFARETGFKGKFRIRFFNWDQYLGSLEGALESPSSPDLIQVPSSWLPFLIKRGILAPLSGALTAKDTGAFVSEALKACVSSDDGRLYGLPWFVDVRLLFYKRSQFPNPAEVFRNGTSFARELRAIRSRSGQPPFAMPTAIDWDLMHQTAMIIWMFGGDMINWDNWPLPPKARFESEMNCEAMEYLRGLAETDCLDLPRITRYKLEDDFLAGRYACIFCGPWLTLKASRLHGGALLDSLGAVIPGFGGNIKKVTILGGSALSMSCRVVDSAKRKVVLDLIDFLAASPSTVRYARLTGQPPGCLEYLGLADSAMSRHSEIRDGSINPTTYLEYLSGIGVNEDVIRSIEEAISSGRSYRPNPDWAQYIELPATRTGLYHLWQDLAGGEPREVIRADLKRISDDINGTLYRPRFYVRIIAGLVLLVILIVILAYVRMFFVHRGFKRLQKKINDLDDERSRLNTDKEEMVGRLDQALREKESEMDIQISKLKREIEEKSKSIAAKDDCIRALEDHKAKLIKSANTLAAIIFRFKKSTTAEKDKPVPTFQRNMKNIDNIMKAAWRSFESPQKLDYQGMVCTSDSPLVWVIKKIKQISKRRDRVLITGETGTGKELIAKAIHSERKKKGGFFGFNMAGFSKDNASAELFGSCPGAFAGAVEKEGIFERAGKGTVFLDEFGDMHPEIQGMLLRALEENATRRVGGVKHGNGRDHTRTIDFHADIIAATNADLTNNTIERPLIRRDLLHRLGATHIVLPPLRNRPGDIPLLLRNFLDKNSENAATKLKISREIVEAAVCYHWPGNIRELKNFTTELFNVPRANERNEILLKDIQADPSFPEDFFRAYEVVRLDPLVNEEFERLKSKSEEFLSFQLKAFDRAAPSGGTPTTGSRKLSVKEELEEKYREYDYGKAYISKRVLIQLYEHIDGILETGRRYSGKRTVLKKEFCKKFLGVDESTIRNWRAQK